MGNTINIITKLLPINEDLVERWEHIGLLEDLSDEVKLYLAVYYEETLRYLVVREKNRAYAINGDALLIQDNGISDVETIIFPCLRRLCDAKKLPFIQHSLHVDDRKLYLDSVKAYVNDEMVTDEQHYSILRKNINHFITALIDELTKFMSNRQMIHDLSISPNIDVECEMLKMYCDGFDIKNLRF